MYISLGVSNAGFKQYILLLSNSLRNFLRCLKFERHMVLTNLSSFVDIVSFCGDLVAISI